jgi:tetratricopeptide (TPR) repeat protein
MWGNKKDKENEKHKEAEETNKRGEEAFERKNFENALELFRKALNATDKDDPNIPKYKLNIERAKAAKANKEANVLDLQGDLEGAIKKFNEAIDILKPFITTASINVERNKIINSLASTYNKLGDKYFALGDFEKAKENYENAASRNNPQSDELKMAEYAGNITKAERAIGNRNAEMYNREGKLKLIKNFTNIF